MKADSKELVRFLGWFGIGLGFAQIALPHGITSLIGVKSEPANRRWALMVGLREIIAGVGILSNPGKATGWLWARVAGDMMDLSLLGAALASNNTRKVRVVAAVAAVLGITLLDLQESQQFSK